MSWPEGRPCPHRPPMPGESRQAPPPLNSEDKIVLNSLKNEETMAKKFFRCWNAFFRWRITVNVNFHFHDGSVFVNNLNNQQLKQLDS